MNTTMRAASWATGGIFLAISITGCSMDFPWNGSGTQTPAAPPSPGHVVGIAVACISDADCASSELSCNRGRCAAPGCEGDSCQFSSNCMAGFACTAGGTCVDLRPWCATVSDCSSGETCFEHQCQPLASGSVSAPWCPASLSGPPAEPGPYTGGGPAPQSPAPSDGSSPPPPGNVPPTACVTDADCVGAWCTAGSCQFVPPPSTCAFDSECGAGETCSFGECMLSSAPSPQ